MNVNDHLSGALVGVLCIIGAALYYFIVIMLFVRHMRRKIFAINPQDSDIKTCKKCGQVYVKNKHGKWVEADFDVMSLNCDCDIFK